MGELGVHANRCHREAGAYARAAGIDVLYTVGDNAALAAEAYGPGARHYASVDALSDALVSGARPALAPGTTVLVKGSRFMRMERVVEALAAGAAEKVAVKEGH
jgi:UDP-N-acetylmuramoyl-tripeptide--D-alanyl-D-alanine ligase